MFYCPLGVNLTMVLAATAASMVFGGLWYSVLFGKTWAEALGKPKDQLGNPWVGLAVMFGCTLITAVSLGLLVFYLDVSRVTGGLKLGLLAGVGFVAAALLTNNTYEKRPLRLFLINAGYQAGSIILMAVLMARFR